MAWNNRKRNYGGQGYTSKPTINSGMLRHRITLQDYASSKDSMGAEVKSWNNYAEVWASVEPLSGKELYKAQQIHAETTTRIIIRYLNGVNTKMRAVFKDREYDILHILNKEERNTAMYLLCKDRDKKLEG